MKGTSCHIFIIIHVSCFSRWVVVIRTAVWFLLAMFLLSLVEVLQLRLFPGQRRQRKTKRHCEFLSSHWQHESSGSPQRCISSYRLWRWCWWPRGSVEHSSELNTQGIAAHPEQNDIVVPLVTGVRSRPPGGRLNKKDGLTRYGNSHVKDKTS